jgi:hypothetical protein
MPHPRVRLTPTGADIPDGVLADLRDRFAAVRADLDLSLDYPAEALAEAERVAAQPPPLPERDETHLPFITLDPPGSMDLDQAMHLEREGDGYRVRYAIADVPAFVRLGGALDAVTRDRGQTVYCPDLRVPLHPEVLSEGAGSLLPDAVRPAFVWDLRLDAEGVLGVVRGVPGHGAQRAAPGVRRGAGRPSMPAPTTSASCCLREIGERRIERERVRGGASLPMPEQQIVERPDGGFTIEFRPPVPAEEWNAQISLLTGLAAASMMLEAGVGVLRTMPAPAAGAVAQYRRVARALGAQLAPVDALRRVHPLPGPHRPPPPGAHPRGKRAVPRRRVHRLRTVICPAQRVPRNVRAPKGRVVANGHPGRPAGQCHRKQTASGRWLAG